MREPTRHREAYAAYLALGAERSIERLHAERAAAGRTPSLRTLYEWSRCFHWQDRLAAFEHRARAAAEEAELEAIRAMHARQVTEALLLQQKGAAWLQGVAADAASPEAAIRAITEGAKLERLVRGVPTERTEAVDATTARVEGLADDALDRLLQLAEGAVGGKWSALGRVPGARAGCCARGRRLITRDRPRNMLASAPPVAFREVERRPR